jgi:putative MATE family efflux protein
MKKMKQSQDLTKGSIYRRIILFALPLLGSSLIQQLYNTVDLLFVGNCLGKNSYAAVGASSLIISCLVGFFTGMSVGSGVVIAQAIGSRDKKAVQDSVHTAMGLSFAGGIVLMAVGWLGAPHFLEWMNVEPEILGEAVSYLRIYFLSLTSVITYNMASGIIRAMGNSQVPMLTQLAGGIANVIADAVMIQNFPSVESAAWASMISQTLAAGMCLAYLIKQGGDCRLVWKKVRIQKAILAKIIKIGVPAGTQNLVITISNIFAQYHINSLGVDVIGAFTTYFRMELLLYHPIVALGQTMTTFAGQNMGACRPDRVRKGVRFCMFGGIALTVSTAAFLLFFGEPVFGLFTKDAAVVENGLKVIWITFPFYWLYVILEVLADTVRGAGKAMPPMVIILSNICILRTVLLFVIMSMWQDIRGIAAAYPITWGITALCMSAYYVKGRWDGRKERRRMGTGRYQKAVT